MNLEHLILPASAAFFLLCAAWAFWPRGKKISLPSALAGTHPIRSAFESIEDEAKNLAARQIAEAIGARYAEEYKQKVVGAIAPKDGSAPSGGA